MNNLKKYNGFILERHDKNIKREISKLGITDNFEINKMINASKHGHLRNYLNKKGKVFTFGLLNAIFLDAISAKKTSDIKSGVVKMAHRIIPMAMAPFFPILAIVGYILGTSRAFNKVITPILSNPGTNYPDFLNKIIINTMKLAEGEITTKDRFTRAFVISDNIIDAIKPSVLVEFSLFLSEKMSKEDPNGEVPNNYIENELKNYLNNRYYIEPKIPLKNINI